MGFLKLILGWLTGGGGIEAIATNLAKAYEAKQNATTEQARIEADTRIKYWETQASVVREGMQHKAFWIPWLIATVPTAMWFGWGMADSLFNGGLPDVASLPPQLKEYADTVWQNIFFTGGAVAGAGVVAKAIERVVRR